MTEGNSFIMTLQNTKKYLKRGKFTLYKIAREDRIPAVKIEFRKNNRVVIHVPYNQELINISTIDSYMSELYDIPSKT